MNNQTHRLARGAIRSAAGACGLLLATSVAGCAGPSPEPTSSKVTTSSAITAVAVSGAPASTSPTTVTSTPNQLLTGQAPVNGPITSAEKYLAAADAGGYQWRSFDEASDKGLYVSAPDRGPVESITVVGTHGPLATLTCARELQCLKDDWLNIAAALGPGADEVTIESGDRTVQVVAYDGGVRRTLDLGATVPRGDTIWGLSWSPHGSRLAVLTLRTSDLRKDIWLVDAGGAGRRE